MRVDEPQQPSPHALSVRVGWTAMLSRNRWSVRASTTTRPATGSPVTNTLPAATSAAWSASMGAGTTPMRAM